PWRPNRDLLLPGEPLSGTDPLGRRETVALFRELERRGKCLLLSSHELEELEKLTDHVAIMARGRIAAVGTVGQIRDRLDAHPLLVRIAVKPGDRPPAEKQRDLASLLLRLEEVLAVELVDGDEDCTVLVRARNPQHFFAALTRLVLEEWLEISRVEALDDSAEAVLGYLLGATRPGHG